MSIIYLTDDIMRPDDGNGKPAESTSTALYLNVNGNSFKWYTQWTISFNENATSASGLNAVLSAGDVVFGRGQYGIISGMRAVAQISENNFSSIKSETTYTCDGGYGASIYGFSTHSRNYSINDSAHGTNHDPLSEAPGSGYFWGYKAYPSFNLTSLSVSNKQIWVRIKMQYKNSSGNWVDCSRSSGLSVWKTYTTYAPFFQSVTPPAHFYANALNQFTASIAANYTSEITDIYGYTADNVQVFPKNGTQIVRNENPPYITSGTATSYLYFPPFVSVNATNKPTRYYFTLSLKITDPSDSNYKIFAAQRIITGSVEYKSSDDITGLYGTPTWSLTDPSGMYEQYGVLLRNIATKLVYHVSANVKYGAPVRVTYYDAGRSYRRDIVLDNSFNGTADISFKSTGTNQTFDIRVEGFNDTQILNDSVTVPFVNYLSPSLPSVSIHRCESDGSPNDMGAYCRIDWSVFITSINNQNAKKLVINHPMGTATYDPLSAYTQSGSLVVAANTERSYTIVLTVSDSFGSYTRSLRLSTASVTMDWLYNGKGIGFGTVATKEDVVEIAEHWKLIVYNMLFNNTDMAQWMNLILSRIEALEQFAVNTGSTTQFPVAFYNYDGQLLKKQWVKSGQYATAPSETPTREPTTTTVYTFYRWLVNGMYVDPATTPITTARDFTAYFTSATRKYSVLWYNGNTLLETDDNLNYHANASYGGSAPTKSGYTFAGWKPSGKYIEGSENAMAQFFQDTEISDSWEDILMAVDDGTATSKYKPGNWKTLTTAEGNFKMRIIGFRLDELAGSKAKATISWRSIDAIRSRTMNPALQYETQTETIYNWNYTAATGYYTFTSNTKGKRSATYPGTVTVKITCKGSGTFKIGYKYTNSGGTLVIKVNGDIAYSGNGGSTTMTYLEYPCSNGTVFNIELQSYATYSVSPYYEYDDTKVVELNWASVTSGVTISNMVRSTRIKTSIKRYTDGTGCVGGWKACQMRTWMNGDFYNGIDYIVRNKIKTVNKYTCSMVSDETVDNKYVIVPNDLTQDKVFLLSRSEVSGNTANENGGLDWDLRNFAPSSKFYRSSDTDSSSRTRLILKEEDATYEYDGVNVAPKLFWNSNGSEPDYSANTYYYFGFCT